MLHQSFTKTENMIIQNLKTKRKIRTSKEQAEYLVAELASKYPIVSIEDGMYGKTTGMDGNI